MGANIGRSTAKAWSQPRFVHDSPMPADPSASEPHIPPGSPGSGVAENRQALAGLVRAHDRLLHSFLMARVRDEHVAREIAQEAYVRMLNLEEPGAVSFMRAYLFKTASGRAITLQTLGVTSCIIVAITTEQQTRGVGSHEFVRLASFCVRGNHHAGAGGLR